MMTTLTVYVMTKDLEKLRSFYEAGLGVPAAERQGNWVPFSLGGATFALHAASADDDLKRVTLSFGVDDIERAVEGFRAAGGSLLRGVAGETFGRMATLQDPDGRAFELVQYG
jgi:predicted enzyme related to lactoylglutathione lyase